MIRILQWNINGVLAKLFELRQLISLYQPTVICLQETRLKPGQPFNIKNYNIYRADFQSGSIASGGVATLVHDSAVLTSQQSLAVGIQNIILQISSPNSVHLKQFTIGNIYIPPNQEVTINDLHSIITQVQGPRIFAGDVNAHSPTWGSQTSNNKGKIFEKYLREDEDVVLLNNGAPTRFNSFNGSFSAIDLTLASVTLAPFLEWSVHNDLCSSDHFPIITTERCTNQDPNQKPPRWMLKLADWNLFMEMCANMQVSEPDNINFMLNNFNNTIVEAARRAIPRSKAIVNPKKVPWWNLTIQQAVKNRKKALAKFRTTRLIEDLQNFRKIRAQARHLIRTEKQKSWHRFIESIDTQTSNQYIWTKIKALNGCKTYFSIPWISASDTTITSPKEIANTLATTFADKSSNANYPAAFHDFKMDQERYNINLDAESSESYNDTFTLVELQESLQHFKKNSSPGPDDIPAIFVKNLPQTAVNALLQIYNKVWMDRTFPDVWSTSIVIPILKPGKSIWQPGFEQI